MKNINPQLSKITEDLRLGSMLARRDLKNRYVGSYAGMAWNIGVPLLYAIINVAVFSILMRGRMGARYGDIPFALFYFVPLTLWTFFADVVGRSTGILREYGYLINKIAFPFWVLPLVPIASALLNQGILLVLVAGMMIKNGIIPADTALLYIPLWLCCILITTGVAYAVAALAVYIPDLAQIVPLVVNIMFWLTPILYPATLVEKSGSLWIRKLIMDYNPFSYIVELSRHAVFGSAHVPLHSLTALGLVSFLVMLSGMTVFRKLKSGFADVI